MTGDTRLPDGIGALRKPGIGVDGHGPLPGGDGPRALRGPRCLDLGPALAMKPRVHAVALNYNVDC
jgi:hypothetical protein